MGAAFLNCNRNKTALALDLKQPEARARLLELVAGADVFVHNMRTAAATRLGLTYEQLRGVNPGLVHCAITGFAQDGPYRDQPAYDDVIQAASGWAGLQQRVGGEPSYAPTIVADKTTSLYAVGAINAALFHRARTGAGQAIEVPMFEAMVAFLAVEHLGGLTFVPPLGPPGYSRVLSPDRRPYRTRDGYIAALPYNGAHWQAFFQAAGQAAWAADPGLASAESRAAMVGTLYQRLAACLPERTTAEWLVLLRAADIPCSPVNGLDDLLTDPHALATGLFEQVEHPTEGPILQVRSPVRYSATPCGTTGPAPPMARCS